jgi:hypothetical protein
MNTTTQVEIIYNNKGRISSLILPAITSIEAWRVP